MLSKLGPANLCFPCCILADDLLLPVKLNVERPCCILKNLWIVKGRWKEACIQFGLEHFAFCGVVTYLVLANFSFCGCSSVT